jgi:hypothetical protein
VVKMPKIEQLLAWVIADKDEDDEGVPAFNTDMGPMPMMGADLGRVLGTMRQIAQQAADMQGKPIKLIRSTGIEVVEVIQPRSKK